jgi:hypothetical protein
MTDELISDELVEATARAVRDQVELAHGGERDVAPILDLDRKVARAALTAALPLLQRAIYEGAAKIAESHYDILASDDNYAFGYRAATRTISAAIRARAISDSEDGR